VQLLVRLRIFLDQLQLLDVPLSGGVSSPTACSVAVVKAYQPKLSSFGLNFTTTTYRIDALVFDDLFKALCVNVRFRANAYIMCVFGQYIWCVVCCDIHMARPRPPGTELARERKATRKSEKVPYNPNRPPIAIHHSVVERPLLAAWKSTSGGLCNFACRSSPSRYINLPGSLPEYPIPSLALIP
jgi:hypothetical protein